MQIGDRTEVEIGENTFFVERYEPFKAIKVLGNLQKVFLPVLKEAIGGLNGASDETLDKDIKSITDVAHIMPLLEGVFGGLSEHLDGQKLENTMNTLLDKNYIAVINPDTDKRVQLDKSMINKLFIGNLSDMFKLAFEVVKINYADFFTTLNTQFGNLMASTAQPIKSPAK